MHTPRKLTPQSTIFYPTELFTLMEESPPPVPPKDPKYASVSSRMELDRPPTAPTSGSKRKREVHLETYTDNDLSDDPAYADQPTPNKRSRSVRQSDNSASEDAAGKPRNIRRKKGPNNLSYMNLRHAAKQQASQRTLSKESKFQEGSLTDKPSDRPPSIFIRSASSNYRDDDQLMEDYHDGRPTPRASIDGAGMVAGRSGAEYQLQSALMADKKEEAPGFFHFGRQLAATFHPTTLWRRLWHEPKEDVAQHTEDGRKAQQKLDAEAKYAKMKKSGQLKLQPVGRLASDNIGDGLETPRDSGVEIDSLDTTRSNLRASTFLQAGDSESEAPDTTSKTKTVRGRFGHFKKPSLHNIKSDLKRVTSDINLTATLRNRESSSSISPVKQDFGSASLKRSESKFDLRKQQKLSKRVSDLEVKLARARSELDDALVEASPAPKLTGRYERFTPSATIKRPKFMPGKLPSLPSERILMAQEAAAEKEARGSTEGEGRQLTLKEALDEAAEEGAKDDTIKASRGLQKYPRRASSLFNLDEINHNSELEKPSDKTTTKNSTSNDIEMTGTEEQVKPTTTEVVETAKMDNNETADTTTDDTTSAPVKKTYASLDAKLKALDANVKSARKAAQPKKRKSAANDEDKPFKPGRNDSDDDAEWEEATPKKKRKSAHGSSPQTKRSGDGKVKASSPKNKKTTALGGSGEWFGTSPEGKRKDSKQTDSSDKAAPAEPEADAPTNGNAAAQQEESSADEGAALEDDTQAEALDVVYEEEEAPGPEETLFTRAADAAKAHPARNGAVKSLSPPPNARFSKTVAVDEVVKVKPGVGGVPKLPKGAIGSFETLPGVREEETETQTEKVIVGTEVVTRKRASFEWPEDVF
ncbi:uncharacterized protein LTR77_002864 [Saxophila tyrrhenica]|uniref:Uncharacterized protein n=1 Tax=Saxophila tyrrhenica TaxID=1690608 RepID=A0AAV9PIK7_9PEZI|nr:hypothetical protein LTR77_002864 [Saxophila tyrrhenica]